MAAVSDSILNTQPSRPFNGCQMVGCQHQLSLLWLLVVGAEACCRKRCEPLRHSRVGSIIGQGDGAWPWPTGVQCFEDEDLVKQL